MFVARQATAVTPADATAVKFKGIYVGTAGALSVTMANGSNVIFGAVPAGTTLWISVIAVRSTGTTATNIVGLN